MSVLQIKNTKNNNGKVKVTLIFLLFQFYYKGGDVRSDVIIVIRSWAT